ncbi:GTP-binding protein [uncultured Clostridium sp.]|uniref:CobW family GTP-binding protein n=1 Tax=uncultured Clostridium sp. TaxID=59620 RepID=UPI0025D82160|nr:GTP-binding protein [uncultured Clostridium sp.]
MITKIDIISGFLGAGKTTLIKKLIESDLKKERLAIIENEFGEVSIDGDLLKGTNIDMKEISSGCICCSLVGDFKEAIKEIVKKYSPDRILIEPSGVAKLSDIIKSCKEIESIKIDNIYTVIDVSNYNSYLNNFGEFYKDQIKKAEIIIASRRDNNEKDIEEIVKSIKKLNKECNIITAPLDEFEGNDILNISKKEISNKVEFNRGISYQKVGIVHKNNKASNVFNSWGIETKKFVSKSKLKSIFIEKISGDDYGNILRGKGIVQLDEGRWVEFHYTPGSFQMNAIASQKVGKIAIIGESINTKKLDKLFAFAKKE